LAAGQKIQTSVEWINTGPQQNRTESVRFKFDRVLFSWYIIIVLLNIPRPQLPLPRSLYGQT
jgi:hypothetical protein